MWRSVTFLESELTAVQALSSTDFATDGGFSIRSVSGFGAGLGVSLDAWDPGTLVLFPEMDPTVDVPEITTSCWGILKKSPDSVMCASARMIVKRNGAARPAVVACTLLPYDPQFELGETLADSVGAVPLNHPHCAKFCVLGGAACSQ